MSQMYFFPLKPVFFRPVWTHHDTSKQKPTSHFSAKQSTPRKPKGKKMLRLGFCWYTPVSSNVASWEIYEVNGGLDRWENHRNQWLI